MPFCLIGLGSNQGNRQQLLDTAVARIAAHVGVQLVGVSSWHETAPIGGPPGQPLFLNGALTVETSLSPEQMLACLRQLEHELGRRREERWAQRPIDLDLLLYDDVVLESPSLQVPHPRMAWRRFVLEPAVEVAGAMVHPTIRWTLARLLEHLNTAAWYVAITGPIAVGKSGLARRLVDLLPAQWIAEQPDWGHLAAFYADPASQGLAMELEFVDQRARSLDCVAQTACGTVSADKKRWAVSDFWFDQSLAFARAWLPPDRLPALRERWLERRREVPQPMLTVLLDAPAETLLGRLRARGRACEQGVTLDQLERIRRAILEEVGRPDVGPVLRLSNDDHDATLAEALAAVRATE